MGLYNVCPYLRTFGEYGIYGLIVCHLFVHLESSQENYIWAYVLSVHPFSFRKFFFVWAYIMSVRPFGRLENFSYDAACACR